MMTKLRVLTTLVMVAPFTGAQGARVSPLPEVNWPKIRLPTQELEVVWPDWKRFEWKLPVRLMSGYLPRLIADGHKVPDPIALLGVVFLETENVEIWTLRRNGRVAARPPGSRGEFDHQGFPIAAAASVHDPRTLTLLFTCVADTLTQSQVQDDWITEVHYAENPSVAEGRELLDFKPDLVISFHGPKPARVEFDFDCSRALIECAGEWGFYALDASAVGILWNLREI